MSNDRLALSQAALLFAYAIGMAGGQLLFKSAALRYVSDAPLAERLFSLVAARLPKSSNERAAECWLMIATPRVLRRDCKR